MPRILIGAAFAVLAATAAQAQFSNTGNTGLAPGMGVNLGGGERRLSPEEQAQERQIESRYRESADKIPEKKGTNDPWGNIRQAPKR